MRPLRRSLVSLSVVVSLLGCTAYALAAWRPFMAPTTLAPPPVARPAEKVVPPPPPAATAPPPTQKADVPLLGFGLRLANGLLVSTQMDRVHLQALYQGPLPAGQLPEVSVIEGGGAEMSIANGGQPLPPGQYGMVLGFMGKDSPVRVTITQQRSNPLGPVVLATCESGKAGFSTTPGPFACTGRLTLTQGQAVYVTLKATVAYLASPNGASSPVLKSIAFESP